MLAPKLKKTKKRLFPVVKENRSVMQYEEISVRIDNWVPKCQCYPIVYNLGFCQFCHTSKCHMKPAMVLSSFPCAFYVAKVLKTTECALSPYPVRRTLQSSLLIDLRVDLLSRLLYPLAEFPLGLTTLGFSM